jgi:N-methylhydantoinase A
MERALRVISVERGYDPRAFTLVAFGGAGPLHAAELAQALGIPRVLIPPSPGVLCALGALVAPWMREFSRTVLGLPQDELETAWEGLAARARAEMGGRLGLQRLADLRYRGQGHELTVRWPSQGAAGLAAAFARAHRRSYGYVRQGFPLELVTLRLRATARRPRPRLEGAPPRSHGAARAAWHRTLWLGDPPSPYSCPVWQREALRPGHFFDGPGLVAQYDSTTVLPWHWWGRVDAWGNLVLEPER